MRPARGETLDLRHAYTALVLQFPPFLVGIMAAVVSFLCAGLQVLDARRIGASHQAVMTGVAWGAWAGSLTALVTGLVVVAWLRQSDRELGLRIRASIGIAIGIFTGPMGALSGGWLGARMAGTDATAILQALADSTGALLPAVLVPMLMAIAAAVPPSKSKS